MMRKRVFYCYLLGIAFLFYSCRPNEDSDLVYTNKQVYASMLFYYLWYETIPEVDPAIYPSPQELLKDLVYTPIDRWSFIITAAEYDQYFIQGEYIGHGFSSKFDNNNDLRISFIYKDSDLYPKGVRRGWKLLQVNGTAITTDNYTTSIFGPSTVGHINNLVFEDHDGQRRELTSAKKEIKVNTVLHSGIINFGAKKVGHLVFESFIGPSKAELDSVFTIFAGAGITDLILDLRYNGGGSTDVALYLASYINGNMAEDEVLVSYIHNNKNEDKNRVETISRLPNSVSVNNLIVISTKATASASELVINGLEPYINVLQVGDDTHGKPAGMYVLDLPRMGLVLAPVCFKLANSEGYGDYFDGLQADTYVEDDLTRDFNDSTEACLDAALYYLEYGSFRPTIKKSVIRREVYKESITGLDILIGNTIIE